MRVGADTISIEIAGEAFELRPSLRACLRLTDRHGLSALFKAVSEFNVGILLDMLKEATGKPALLLDEIAKRGVGFTYFRLTETLSKFVLAIAGVDPDKPAAPEAKPGKPLTPAEYHSQLFEIATGWLGWPPEQAWHATPAEILAAQKGRTDLVTDILKAVFGTRSDGNKSALAYTPEKLAEIEAADLDPEFDRAGLLALKAKIQGWA